MKHQMVLEHDEGFVCNLHVDESRAFLGLSRNTEEPAENPTITVKKNVVCVLSTETFDRLGTIDIGAESSLMPNWYSIEFVIIYLRLDDAFK